MNKIKEILIGSNNKGKIREISNLLPKKIKKVSPLDLNIPSPPENGKTYIENSEIKANFFSERSKMITISDDSGLEISCLNGMPGIHSSRWADEHGGFENAMLEILKQVNKKEKDNKAKFICALTIVWPDGKKISEQGIIEGSITKKKGNNGFGYDPIFIPNGFSMTFGEMEHKDKILIDHRYIAYKKLEKKIKDYF